MIDIHAVSSAYTLGMTTAYDLKVGDVYVGAFGMAERSGFRKGTVEFDAFTSGYALALEPFEVWTDRETLVVTRIVSKVRAHA